MAAGVREGLLDHPVGDEVGVGGDRGGVSAHRDRDRGAVAASGLDERVELVETRTRCERRVAVAAPGVLGLRGRGADHPEDGAHLGERGAGGLADRR